MSLPELSSSSAIGIFDSGIGGLTVFEELHRLLPQENLIYLGDTARVPYGNKSQETVVRYSLQIADFLLKQNIKLLIIACNTASAFALEELKEKLSIPVYGVIGAGVQAALRKTSSGRIGIIGTEGTIQSRAYQSLLLKQRADARVFAQPCPLFVPLVEEGWFSGEIPEKIASTYLEPLVAEKIDTLILGCTHYPLLKPTLQKILGTQVTLVDSAEETALAIQAVIKKTGVHPQGTHRFFVTDSPERFRRVGQNILKTEIADVVHIDL